MKKGGNRTKPYLGRLTLVEIPSASATTFNILSSKPHRKKILNVRSQAARSFDVRLSVFATFRRHATLLLVMTLILGGI